MIVRRLGSLFLLAFALIAVPVQATAGAAGIGVRHVTFVDAKRAIKASMGFAGSADRRLDVTIWYPSDGKVDASVADAPIAQGGARPLLIYSHGTFGSPDNAMHVVRDLVAQGYIVAAPAYPLTSNAAFTKISNADISDVHNQPLDIRFILDSLLADPKWSAAIDKDRIGLFGHSLGAVTSYFTVYGGKFRDPRVKALVLLGGGDPVQAALSNDMGFLNTANIPVPVPVLFVSAQYDVFANLVGRPYAAFSRVSGPKYEVMIAGGTHVWLRDSVDRPASGRNPDCAFFDRGMPGVKIPGCSDTPPLIDPLQEQEVVRFAVRNFFDFHLLGDRAAGSRLAGIAATFKGVTLRHED